MSSFFNDVAVNVTKIPDALSENVHAASAWDWKVISGLVISIVSKPQVDEGNGLWDRY